MTNSQLPQIYVISPPEIDVNNFVLLIEKIMYKTQISCIRLGLSSILKEELVKTISKIREFLIPFDIPIIIENHYKLVRELELNGVHLTDGSNSVKHARKHLGSDHIIGAYCGSSRHNALIAAEAGANYISMGPLVKNKHGNERITPIETFKWWSKFIEIPIVAEGNLNQNVIGKLLSVTDFVAIGSEIWGSKNFDSTLEELISPLKLG
jgi:thiamine-phosphate pyrophosphorylase